MQKDINKLGLQVALEMLFKKDKEVRQLKKDRLLINFTIKMLNETVDSKDKEITRLKCLLKKNYITQ
tara:strand:+ start:25 stop:225 length:201 start_codon:yes stop_codon:yes gene_type:complete